jgi:murein L,D-transpeptidase YafK
LISPKFRLEDSRNQEGISRKSPNYDFWKTREFIEFRCSKYQRDSSVCGRGRRERERERSVEYSSQGKRRK